MKKNLLAMALLSFGLSYVASCFSRLDLDIEAFLQKDNMYLLKAHERKVNAVVTPQELLQFVVFSHGVQDKNNALSFL